MLAKGTAIPLLYRGFGAYLPILIELVDLLSFTTALDFRNVASKCHIQSIYSRQRVQNGQSKCVVVSEIVENDVVQAQRVMVDQVKILSVTVMLDMNQKTHKKKSVNYLNSSLDYDISFEHL